MSGLTCRACGTAVTGTSRFCPSCGGSLLMPQSSGDAPVDPWIGKLVQGRFRVEDRLGAGGMGVVYKAEQVAMRRPVALKMLHPQLVQDAEVVTRFENEAAACSKLTHPNTITVHDFGQAEDGSLFIAMEYIAGRSLEQELRTSGALPWERAVKIAIQICASLAEAHGHGIVHRDLKPGNIMLFERAGSPDTVKVLDFGIAKICEGVGGVDQRQALTRTGMVFGTPQYMSPEQIKGEKVGPRSDLYAVGVILYEMLTGDLPFSAETPMGMLTKHLLELPRPLRQALPSLQAPASLERIVMAAMAKEPDERPASMEDFGRELESCLADEGGGTDPLFAGARREPSGAQVLSAPAGIAPTRLGSSDSGATTGRPARRGSPGALWGAIGLLGLCVVGAGAWTLSRASSAEDLQAQPTPPVLAGPVRPVGPARPAFPVGAPAPIAQPPVAPAPVPVPTVPVSTGTCALEADARSSAVADLLGIAAAPLRACATTGSLQFRYRITGRSATADVETTPGDARACVEAAVAALAYPADAVGRVEVTMSVQGARCSGNVTWTRQTSGRPSRGPGKKDEVLPGSR